MVTPSQASDTATVSLDAALPLFHHAQDNTMLALVVREFLQTRGETKHLDQEKNSMNWIISSDPALSPLVLLVCLAIQA